MTTNRAGARWRAAAVVVTLVVGAGATLATSPGPDDCPDPPAEREVSAFYGQQEHDDAVRRPAGSWTLTVDGREIPVQADVHTPACISADDPDADVLVTLTFEGERIGAAPEDSLSTLTIRDGRGRVWHPGRVDSEAWRAQEHELDDTPVPARAYLHFALPLDIEPPVTLHLGDLSGDVASIPLDETPASP